MNERFFITIPASFILWFAAIAIVTLGINHEVTKPMMGQSNITIRLISLSAKPAAQIQEDVAKPEKTSVKKLIKKFVEQKAPKPKQAWSEAKSDNNGAVIIYQPMPKIPDDLRKEALSSFALIRFHIAADNNATIELLKPAENPRLNRILLETLKTWKFKAATENGQPVASKFDIRIHFLTE